MEEDEKEKKKRIINDTLKNCAVFLNEDNSNNSKWFSFKSYMKNASDTFKFNYLSRSFKTKYPENTKLQIYNNQFDLTDENERDKFENFLKNIIYFSYRKNYPNQKSYKTNENFNSDCGWGCMIRSSQMIFAKAIYEIIKYGGEDISHSLFDTICCFIEYPFNVSETPPILSKYKKKIEDLFTNKKKNEKLKNENENKEIIEKKEKNETEIGIKNDIISNNRNKKIIGIYPPFSIKNICSIGEIVNKSCGEWFSDANMPLIFKIINNNYKIIDNLEIINFQTTIIIDKILKKCFKEISLNNKNFKENNSFLFENKKYQFIKYGLIFVSVRIGINSIDKVYYESIKNLFNCKECLGFIGGKSYKASYFIGHDDNNILYLDPHHAQDSVIPPLNSEKIQSYLNKTIFQLSFEKLQPAFTIAFLFRDLNEFKDLYQYFTQNTSNDNSCFFFSNHNFFNHDSSDDNDNYKESENEKNDIYIDNENDDF